MSCASLAVVDCVQSLGGDYELLLSGPEGGEVCTAEAHAWHRASPDRHGEHDLAISLCAGKLRVGVNLDTLAALQNAAVAAVEAGCCTFVPPEIVPEPEKAVALHLNVEAAAAAVRNNVRRRTMGIAVKGASRGVQLLLHASRGDSAYPVAMLAAGACRFDHRETRRGRVESSGSMEGVSVQDLTAGGGECLFFLGGGANASYDYEYTPQPAAARLDVKIGQAEAVVSPKFMAELYAFVCVSSVYRSNIAAARAVASGAPQARVSIDAAALSQPHAVAFSVNAGGFKATLPAGDNGGRFCFAIPPFEARNVSSGGVERMSLQVGVSVSAVFAEGEPEESIASISLGLHSARQLARDVGADVPTLLVTLGLGSVDVTLSQKQV